jgi:hypothetical protein
VCANNFFAHEPTQIEFIGIKNGSKISHLGTFNEMLAYRKVDEAVLEVLEEAVEEAVVEEEVVEEVVVEEAVEAVEEEEAVGVVEIDTVKKQVVLHCQISPTLSTCQELSCKHF